MVSVMLGQKEKPLHRQSAPRDGFQKSTYPLLQRDLLELDH